MGVAEPGGVGQRCMFPACVARLTTECPATGSCTIEATAGGATICYANGVTFQTSVDLSRAWPSPVSPGRMAGPRASPWRFRSARPPSTATIHDATGNTVATTTLESSGQVVACVGQPPVVIPLDCGGVTNSGGVDG